MDTPKTLTEAVAYFSDPAVTFKAMLAAKWPDGKITCPKCGADTIGKKRYCSHRFELRNGYISCLFCGYDRRDAIMAGLKWQF